MPTKEVLDGFYLLEKREKIKEGVITNIAKACPDMLNRNVVKLAEKILEDEGSQGVVIKVDRELTKDEVPCGVPCDKCIAVEPLIKEG